MQVLILGSLGGELGKAARIATARGAKLQQVDDERAALSRLRADARVDLVLVELPHDVGSLVRGMSLERIITQSWLAAPTQMHRRRFRRCETARASFCRCRPIPT